ncbi:2-oxo acid dehydrogenase subunit E2 [Candidatus Riesia pediculicola]|uniref:Dihydrolipoamide acetyltransferase component of pyruvate dehydrogenase complex n=1 Tax=Riesia pediculicola (strain USDA) TaxID=515618 RepID=D4G7S5_RIEPU|nr:2-oxo acid dehydrogenase subunit E2 [Candidatus Riesia pediculicola]ADD79894.1 dihydrolipoyllysine-residue acetyltransferase component of pyruvatedehydrogenase complex [Candidatus Riesia pediculicola USDA]ARC53645.1 hypothetical protein AOE55_00535 [Candidatus Riesia pediculicola]QOJ86295.1 2-oxo acid dehydrogenase subunit E2 [Candidatus Riesia pediculicola]
MFIDIRIPEIGVDEVEITDVLVKVGEKVKLDQPLISIEGEKVSLELPSPNSGIVKEIKILKGEIVKKGTLVMVLEDHSNQKELICSNPKKNDQNQLEKVKSIDHIERKFINDRNLNDINEKNQVILHATPVVRRLARKFNVNLNNVKGSGRRNRILPEDILKYVKKAVEKFDLFSKNKKETSLDQEGELNKKIEIPKTLKMNRIQRSSCKKLSETWAMVPHVTVFGEIEVTELESFRKLYNKRLEKCENSFKMTMLPFFLKAVSKIMKDFPIFNSKISDNFQEIEIKKEINVGFAVDTNQGLLVPIIKNVDQIGIFEISKMIIKLSEKARLGKLSLEDMRGGGFTISNLGSTGKNVGFFTPIINSPEVAILGISRSFMKPVWNGSSFLAKLTVPISLSFDHRVINGADGAKFLDQVSFLIQDLRNLLM